MAANGDEIGDVRVGVCVQEIVKHDLEAKAVIQDIWECGGPLRVLNELNFAAKEKLKVLRDRIEDLERLAREQDRETTKRLLLDDVENYKQQLISTQTTLRKANLACKMAIDRGEREDLFKGEDEEVRQRKHTKEQVTKTAGNLTENLMSISRMMANNVKQSENTMHTIVSSSKTVGDTHEEFKSQGGTIQISRKLLSKYNRRELTDKLLIFLAVAFFFATVLYILKKRVFPS
ncbi:vesicle transport protein SEC20-like [Branchiostoma floridae]|uniref:Vesicle transport protein SEC20-like n=1 Tax=Branchiostoma floridae TaxID=7739 RepID=A0A9J7KXI7_BRAFL|nr:vesicle transport protein SEC20-like [Branchiostoma floridae]